MTNKMGKRGGWKFSGGEPESQPVGPAASEPAAAPSLIDRLKERLRPEEGFSPHAYLDSQGIATVGYGYNLQKPGTDAVLSELGLSPTSVRAGWPITRQQAEALLDYEARWAIVHAEHALNGEWRAAPEGPASQWSAANETVRLVLSDMAYQLGQAGLAGFHHALEAFRHQDYVAAAAAMRDSLWHRQTKGRSEELASLVEGLAWPNPEDAA